jgi:anion-transporting  ArsA/GET3 family ATPase
VTVPLDKRLVFVTGKGGVGKTTVATSLGLLAARRGKRTIVCEIGAQGRLASIFGMRDFGHRERELAPGLSGISIDPERSKEEWLRYELRSSTLAGILGHSRLFQYLTAAAPGLQELVTVGKIWELAQLQRKTAHAAPYDLVLVDAPSTGHGVAMLRSPRTFAAVARVGPIHRQAMKIHAFLGNQELTGVVAVALPEEMPVNETLDLGGRLRQEMDLGLDAIVVNALYPERFSAQEAGKLESVDGDPSPAAAAALRAALSEYRWAREQRQQLRRLRRGVEAPVMTLPYLFEPELRRPQVEELSQVLAGKKL